MTDRPIIFSRPMVLAMLEGRKTQTRRLLYSKRTARGGSIPAAGAMLAGHPPPRGGLSAAGWPSDIGVNRYYALVGWHRAVPGDRLWVRENWRADDFAPEDAARTIYQADAPMAVLAETRGVIRWRPSIHMPRSRSRLTLDLTAVKIERLHDISEADAALEGIGPPYLGDGDPPFTEQAVMVSRFMQFRNVWRAIHGEAGWIANPEVVALTFRVIAANIDAPAQEAGK